MPLIGNAQDQSTLSFGIGVNTFESDAGDYEFLNSDFGINIGFF